ncbi:MAG: hypothetical protein AAF430_21825 [Myxococcota bacterium]
MLAPVDLALAPIVAADSIQRHWTAGDDPWAVRVGFLVPGLAWNTSLQALGAVIRETAGLLEFAPGLGLFFFERDLNPLFDPAERGHALLEVDTPRVPLRAGVDYTRPEGPADASTGG